MMNKQVLEFVGCKICKELLNIYMLFILCLRYKSVSKIVAVHKGEIELEWNIR